MFALTAPSFESDLPFGLNQLPSEAGFEDGSADDEFSGRMHPGGTGVGAGAGAVLAHIGEALPWSNYGLVWEFGAEPEAVAFRGRGFVSVGSGRFKQIEFPHANEHLEIEVLARSVTLGRQWPLFSALASSVFSLRAGLGLTSFSGSFTQRGADLSGDTTPTADEFLGSGFSGHVVHTSYASVFSWDLGRWRLEVVPVGFRFALWHRINQDRDTPHQVGLNRYLAGNTVFGLVNVAAGVTF